MPLVVGATGNAVEGHAMNDYEEMQQKLRGFSREELIECLEQNPQIRIYRGHWFQWFIDDELESRLERFPAERFVTLPGAPAG